MPGAAETAVRAEGGDRGGGGWEGGGRPGAAAGAGTESTAPVEVVAQGIDPRAAPCDSLGRYRTAVSSVTGARVNERLIAFARTTSRALFLRQTHSENEIISVKN